MVGHDAKISVQHEQSKGSREIPAYPSRRKNRRTERRMVRNKTSIPGNLGTALRIKRGPKDKKTVCKAVGEAEEE